MLKACWVINQTDKKKKKSVHAHICVFPLQARTMCTNTHTHTRSQRLSAILHVSYALWLKASCVSLFKMVAGGEKETASNNCYMKIFRYILASSYIFFFWWMIITNWEFFCFFLRFKKDPLVSDISVTITTRCLREAGWNQCFDK